MNRLTVEAIQNGLKTEVIGRSVRVFQQIGSTNTELKHLANAGADEGTLLLAEEQLAGRGRFERSWLAPPGTCLLTSLLFRPAFLAPAKAQQITMLCAVAMVEAIGQTTGLAVRLKWPNDIVCNGQKLAGLLTELSFSGDKLDWVIVGLGLNVNVDFSQAHSELSETATSLKQLRGAKIERLPVLQAYLQGVDKHYANLKRGLTPFETWAGLLVTIGQPVTVSGLAETFSGLAQGVDPTGALLVKRENGHIERVLAADVTLRKLAE